MEKKKKAVYMLITQDEYELPLAIADSPRELGKIIGVKSRTISTALVKSKKNKKKKGKYIKVFIEIESEDENGI